MVSTCGFFFFFPVCQFCVNYWLWNEPYGIGADLLNCPTPSVLLSHCGAITEEEADSALVPVSQGPG